MYNIINDLRYCRLLSVININSNRKEIFYLYKAKINIDKRFFSIFPITDSFIDEVKNIYQNVTIEGNNFKLQILQDDGQGCIKPNNYEILPNELLIINANICWFNGSISLCHLKGEILNIIQLKEIPEFDMNNIRNKRPYSYNLCTKNKQIFLYVFINYWDSTIIPYNVRHEEIIIDLHIKYNELFSLVNIKSMINRFEDCNNNFIEKELYNRIILTRDWLVSNNWNYNNGAWQKDDLEILDDKSEKAYFIYNNNPIFFVDEIR